MKMLVVKALLFLSIFSNIYADLNVEAACELVSGLIASDAGIKDKELSRECVLGKIHNLGERFALDDPTKGAADWMSLLLPQFRFVEFTGEDHRIL